MRVLLLLVVVVLGSLSGNVEVVASDDECNLNSVQREGKTLRSKFFGVEYAFIPIYLRRLCEVDGGADERTLKGFLDSAGCSWDTEIGQEFQKVLTGDVGNLSWTSEFRALRDEHPSLAEEYCRYVVDIPWPIYDENGELISDGLYGEYSTAMTKLFAWAHENLRPYADD